VNPSADAVAKAIAQWDSHDLEEAVAAARACGSIVRSNSEWLEHPHGKMLSGKPLIEITKIGDSDPIPSRRRQAARGIKVLDLTRILAGPIAARTLAENGADVLMVTAEHLPQVPEHVMDTSHGKRSCFLNLNKPRRATIKKLVRDADVFSQGYRPGIMDKHGLSPEQLAAEHPGIIYLSISCYGHGGPFSTAAGGSRSPMRQPGYASTTAMNGRSCCRPPPAITRPAITAPTACYSRWRGAHAKAVPTTFESRFAAPACISTSRAT
jgi:crotonobetainyl-CoA:carnitine CoA-transferase CaiB-like acyl-CoA transferase